MKLSPRSARVLHATAAIFLLSCIAGLAHDTPRARHAPADPWTSTQVTQPSQLAALLSKGEQPIILQVGFRVLYRSKHIPGAIYAGPASTPKGLEVLKQAVRTLPKNANIYIYCGCCPIQKCPNIRPAFRTLQAMGFSHLHVVMMPTNFGKDWVAHGYPIAGESAPGR
jgi:thiosulfate/3-mercaptopyruvate sulfurtransferase